MKDQVIKLLMDRVGLDEAKAGQALETVMGFVKENPERLSGLMGSEQAQSFLGKLPGGAGKKISGFLNRD
jgi:hypothetical protein